MLTHAFGFLFLYLNAPQSSVDRTTARRLYFMRAGEDINFSSTNITSISGLLIMTTGTDGIELQSHQRWRRWLIIKHTLSTSRPGDERDRVVSAGFRSLIRRELCRISPPPLTPCKELHVIATTTTTKMYIKSKIRVAWKW